MLNNLKVSIEEYELTEVEKSELISAILKLEEEIR